MRFNIWKDYEYMDLPDILSFIVDNRGKTVPTDVNGNHILIATNCIRNENLYPSYDKVRLIGEDTYKNWFRAHPKPGDIIFVNKGTPGRVCMVPAPVDFCIAQDMIALRVKREIIYNKYLLAVLRSKKIQNQIAATTVGDVIPHFKKQQLREIKIPVPPMKIQKVIGDYYFAFCEKEVINNKINRNLQEQAASIYKKMILDAPDECNEGVLSDIAEIIMGQSPKGDTYNEEGKGTVFYQGRAEFGDRFPNRRLFTTDPKRIAKENSVLVSVRAPVGDINVAYEECCIGRGLSSVVSKDNHQSFVLYTMFSLKDQFDVYNGEGTVFGSINKESMNGMAIHIPNEKLMDEFEEIVSSMDAIIKANYEENYRLVAARDALLPKLMSGELDILDLNI